MNYLLGSFIFLRQVWRHNPIVPIALWAVCTTIFFSQFTVLQILSGATAGLQRNPLRDRIVTISQKDQRTLKRSGVYETAYEMWSSEVKSLTMVTATLHDPALRMSVRFPDGNFKVMRGAVAESGLFPLFHVSPQIGRLFHRNEDSSRADRVLLLGLELWRNTFNSDPNIVGKTLLINDWHYTVIGVLNAEIPSFEGIGLWLNRVNEIEDILHDSEHLHLPFTVFAVMKEGIGLKEVASELRIYYAAMAKDEPNRYANIVPEVVLMTNYVLANAGQSTQVLTYLGAAVVILGFVNAMLLLTVRRMRLRMANQIRMMLGLPLGWFRTECFLETGLLVLSGLIVASAFQYSIKRVLLLFVANPQLGSLGVRDWLNVTLLSVLLILILTVPQTFSSKNKHTRNRRSLLFALVFLETSTVAIMLYLCGVTVRVFVEAQSEVSRGYQTRNLIAARYLKFGEKYLSQENQQRFETSLLQAMGNIPGVSEVTASTYLPLMDDGFADYLYSSNVLDRELSHAVEVMNVRENYFEMFGVKLMAGEQFKVGGALDSVIIDTDAAKLIPCDALNCIGKPVRLMSRTFTVVGVNRPVKFRHVKRQLPQVHIRWDQPKFHRSQVALIVKSSMQLGLLRQKLREATAKVDPRIEPRRIDAIDDLVKEGTRKERMMLNACLVIGLFGLFASSIGILVVTSQIIESQRRECGIRMALGDTAAGVVKILCGPVVLWALIGICCGIFVGTVVQDRLAATIYLQKGFDFSAAFASLLIVTTTIALGLFIPIKTIVDINPADLLKSLTDNAGTRG